MSNSASKKSFLLPFFPIFSASSKDQKLSAVMLNPNFDFSLASTPAMFNSTLTEDENFLCPVDGAVMITGLHLIWKLNGDINYF